MYWLRYPGALAVLLAAALWAAPPAAGGQRIALVIGNGVYERAPTLPNPPNDARLIAATLRTLDFEVLEHLDIGQKQMKIVIRTFGQRLEDEGDDAVGLFYYAGHGLQVKGHNYLVPIDAEIERESDRTTADAVGGLLADRRLLFQTAAAGGRRFR